jgi:hypothetical protein
MRVAFYDGRRRVNEAELGLAANSVYLKIGEAKTVHGSGMKVFLFL